LELAVFGGLALGALTVLIGAGMMANYKQEIRMATFRRALAAAAADNGTDQDAMGVAFHYMSDRQMPDPQDGFMSLPRVRTEASAFVEWGDRLSFAAASRYRTQPRIIVRLNNVEEEVRQSDIGGATLMVTDGTLQNTSGGQITQTNGRSALGSSTTTTSTASTVAGSLSSSLSGGGTCCQ
jgi:hypothetical protein